MKNICMLPKKSGSNVPSKCYRSMILRNGKFLSTVGKSEISRNKSFSTTENAQIVENRCVT